MQNAAQRAEIESLLGPIETHRQELATAHQALERVRSAMATRADDDAQIAAANRRYQQQIDEGGATPANA